MGRRAPNEDRTERFLHMRLTGEDCARLDTLTRVMNEAVAPGGRRFTQSDVVRMAVQETLERRKRPRGWPRTQ